MLINLYPDFLRELKEIQNVCGAEQTEWDELQRISNELYREFSIFTADTPTIRRWERMMGIPLAHGISDSERRVQVQARFLACMPMTAKRFVSVMETLTRTKCDLQIDFNTYTMKLLVYQDDYMNLNQSMVRAQAETMKPANMVFLMNVVAQTHVETEAFCTAAVSTQYRYSDIIPALPIASEQTADSIEQGAIQALFTKQYEIGVA